MKRRGLTIIPRVRITVGDPGGGWRWIFGVQIGATSILLRFGRVDVRVSR